MNPNAASSAAHRRRGRLVSLLIPMLAARLLGGCGGGHAAVEAQEARPRSMDSS